MKAKFFLFVFLMLSLFFSVPVLFANITNVSTNITSQKYLDELSQYFIQAKDYQANILAIVGIKNIGKMTLAKDFVLKHKKEYDLIEMIKPGIPLVEQYINLLGKLKVDIAAKDRINLAIVSKILVDTLQATSHNWLLVLDSEFNCQEFLQAAENMKTIAKKAHIITLLKENPEIFNYIALSFPTTDEVLIFLQRKLKGKRSERKEDLLKLSRAMNNHPILLSKNVNYLKNNPEISIDEYLSPTHLESDMEEGATILQQTEQSAHDLLNRIACEEEKSFYLLELIVMLNEEEITESLLKKLFVAINSGTCEDFYKAIEILNKHAVLTRKNEDGKTVVVVPRFIQNKFLTFMQSQMQCHDKNHNMNNKILQAMANDITGDYYYYKPGIEEMCFLAHKIWVKDGLKKEVFKTFFPLINTCLEHNNYNKNWITSNNSFYSQSEKLLLNIKKTNKQVLANISNFYLQGGNFFFTQMNYTAANDFYTKSLKTASADINNKIIIIYIKLARVGVGRGDLIAAKKYLQKIDLLKTQHGYIGKGISFLEHRLEGEHQIIKARYFIAEGNYQAALDAANKSIQLLCGYAILFSDPKYMQSMSLVVANEKPDINWISKEKSFKLPLIAKYNDEDYIFIKSIYKKIIILDDLIKNKILYNSIDLSENTKDINLRQEHSIDYKAYPADLLILLDSAYNAKHHSIMKLDEEENISYLEEIIRKMTKEKTGKSNRNIIVSKILYIQYLLHKNKFEDAENEINSLESFDREEVFINEPNELQGMIMGIYGRFYLLTNNLETAKFWLQKSFAAYKKAYISLENSYVSDVLFDLCKTNILLNLPFEAQKIYKIHLDIFGETHPQTQAIFYELATK